MGKRFQRFISILLLASIFGGQLAFAAGIECAQALTKKEILDQAENSLKEELLNAEQGVDRLTLRLLKNRIKKEVLEICSKRETCTLENVQETVRAQVQKTLGPVDNLWRKYLLMRGYTLIIAVIVGSAMGASLLKQLLPPSLSWTADAMLPIVTSIGIYQFGSAFMDRIKNVSFTVGNRLGTGKNPFWHSLETDRLDDYSKEMRAHYNPDQQRMFSMYMGLLSVVRSVAKDALDLALIGKVDRAADRLAEIIILRHYYYFFIPADSRNMIRAVRMNMSNHLEEPLRRDLAKATMRAIENGDLELPKMEHKQREKLLAEYRKAVGLWLNVPL